MGVHTASALSPPLSLSLLSPSLPPSPRRLSLSLSPSSSLSLSKGSGAQGFGTERARLVVQVERLWCTRLRHRTCKTSGSSKIAFLRRFPAHQGTSLRSCFQKSACCLFGFRFFFLKIPRIFKLEVGFFSAFFFSQFSQISAHLFHLNFISEKTPKKSEKPFFPPKPPILELEVGFFSSKKKFFAGFPKYSTFFSSKLHFCKFEK